MVLAFAGDSTTTKALPPEAFGAVPPALLPERLAEPFVELLSALFSGSGAEAFTPSSTGVLIPLAGLSAAFLVAFGISLDVISHRTGTHWIPPPLKRFLQNSCRASA